MSNKIKAETIAPAAPTKVYPNRIKFGVININHPHIYGMTEAIKRGGGELVALYAKEPNLVADFLKSFPEAKFPLDGEFTVHPNCSLEDPSSV